MPLELSKAMNVPLMSYVLGICHVLMEYAVVRLRPRNNHLVRAHMWLGTLLTLSIGAKSSIAYLR